ARPPAAQLPQPKSDRKWSVRVRTSVSQLFLQSLRGAARVVAAGDGGGDGDRLQSARQYFIDILLGNARNGDGRDGDFLCHLPRDIRAGDEIAWFGAAFEERPDADVIRPVAEGLFRLIEVVRADAEDFGVSDELSHVPRRQVGLT